MRAALLLCSALLLLSGCAHTVEYDLKENEQIGSRKFNKVVEVKKFADKIPYVRSHVVMIDGQKWRTNPERGYTQGDLAYSLSDMIARHLDKTGMFRNVIYKGGFEETPTSPKEAQWMLTGVISEYSVMGKVNVEAETKATVAGFFGTPGRVAGAIANSYEDTEIRIRITLSNVTLKDVRTGKILWRDTITGTRLSNADFEAAGAGPVYDPPDELLKEIVSELFRRMDKKLEKAPARKKRR